MNAPQPMWLHIASSQRIDGKRHRTHQTSGQAPPIPNDEIVVSVRQGACLLRASAELVELAETLLELASAQRMMQGEGVRR